MQICSVLKGKIFLIFDQKGVTALTASGNNRNKLLQLIAKIVCCALNCFKTSSVGIQHYSNQTI